MKRSTIKKVAVISSAVVAILILLLALIFNHYYHKLQRASASNALATRQNAIESKSVGLDFDGLSEELDKSILDALTSEILREQSRVIVDEQVKALGSELEKQSISNILLVGVDNREGKFDGNSDTIIIVSIDRARKRITLTSVLRDTLVYLDGYGSRRINAAYALGGAEGLESVIKEIYGIDFSGFLVVNFNAVRNAVDKEGGIDLSLRKDEIRLMNAYVNEQNRLVGDDPEKDVIRSYKGGVMHLNGNQALGYARNRYVGTDFHRTMRQRVVIAIALACEPDLLICDEPTTALDVTIQAQILDLINEIKKELNIAVILITHDLGVVAQTADRVIVMYAGEKLEEAPVRELFKNPKHPYTWGLLKSLPRLDMNSNERLTSIPGTPPDLLNPPKGDPFAARSEYAMKIDYERKPPMIDLGGGHFVKSWLYVKGAPKIEFLKDEKNDD